MLLLIAKVSSIPRYNVARHFVDKISQTQSEVRRDTANISSIFFSPRLIQLPKCITAGYRYAPAAAEYQLRFRVHVSLRFSAAGSVSAKVSHPTAGLR